MNEMKNEAAPADVAEIDFREIIRTALDEYTIDSGDVYFFEKAVSDVNEAIRAKLATATELPAKADTPDSFREWFAKNYPADTIIVDPDWHAKSIFRMAQAHSRLAAPQAQADARDAELRHVERRISMIPMRMDKPSEVRVTWSLGEKEPKIQISGWHIDGHGTSLPGNPDAAIHASCNLLLDELERLKAVRETGAEVIYPNGLPMHAYCAAIAAAKGETK